MRQLKRDISVRYWLLMDIPPVPDRLWILLNWHTPAAQEICWSRYAKWIPCIWHLFDAWELMFGLECHHWFGLVRSDKAAHIQAQCQMLDVFPKKHDITKTTNRRTPTCCLFVCLLLLFHHVLLLLFYFFTLYSFSCFVGGGDDAGSFTCEKPRIDSPGVPTDCLSQVIHCLRCMFFPLVSYMLDMLVPMNLSIIE